MAKKQYNIEDLYDVDLKKFIEIFKTEPYASRLDDANNFYYSKVFNNIPYAEQLELFEVYLLKYFYYIYSNNMTNTMAHSGVDMFGHGRYFKLSYFTEIRSLVNVNNSDKLDFCLTILYVDPIDFKKNPPVDRQIVEALLWTDSINADNRSEIGFLRVKTTEFKNEECANQMSKDVFEVLKRVYDKLVEEEEMYAWFILCGIDLKKLLLQEEGANK